MNDGAQKAKELLVNEAMRNERPCVTTRRRAQNQAGKPALLSDEAMACEPTRQWAAVAQKALVRGLWKLLRLLLYKNGMDIL